MFGVFVSLFVLATQETVKLIPVYERTFDDTIVDVIFDTATMTKEEAVKIGWRKEVFEDKSLAKKFLTKGKDKVKVEYPKVVITKHDIRFMDKNGNIKKRIKLPVRLPGEDVFYDPTYGRKVRYPKLLSIVKTSTNGRYILITARYNEFNPNGGGGVLYDWDGNLIWQRDKGYFECVSDDGYVAQGFVSITGAGLPFVIYDVRNNKIKKIELPETIIDAGMRTYGKYFIIAGGEKSTYGNLTYVVIIKGLKEVFRERVEGYRLCSKIFPFNEGILFLGVTGGMFKSIGNKKLWRFSSPFRLDFPQVFKCGEILQIYSPHNGKAIQLKFSSGEIIRSVNLKPNLKFSKQNLVELKGVKIQIINRGEQ